MEILSALEAFFRDEALLDPGEILESAPVFVRTYSKGRILEQDLPVRDSGYIRVRIS